jgi:hypothetical protein
MFLTKRPAPADNPFRLWVPPARHLYNRPGFTQVLFSEKTPFILVFWLPERTFAVLKMSSNGKS